MKLAVIELALLVIDRAFEQRLADALRDAAMHLALDDHRIDEVAEIIDRGPSLDRRRARRRIDFEFADMHARREGEVCRIPKRAFLQAGLEFLPVELMRDISLQRDRAPIGVLVGTFDGELAVLELDVALARFEHVRSDFLRLCLDLVERFDDGRHADRA